MTGAKVNGPILITHTKNDKAVGIAYPLASRINGVKTAALGDENDPYGGIGRNGAQKTPEAVVGELLADRPGLHVHRRQVFQPEGRRLHRRSLGHLQAAGGVGDADEHRDHLRSQRRWHREGRSGQSAPPPFTNSTPSLVEERVAFRVGLVAVVLRADELEQPVLASSARTCSTFV